MKRSLLTFSIVAAVVSLADAQNSPFFIWGTGLNGSTLQTGAIYADVDNGFYFDAPKTSTGAKLPIQFNWRGGGISPLYISPGSLVGIGNSAPQVNLDIGSSQGYGLQLRYDNTANYRIRLTPYWNSTTDTRLDFNVERGAGAGFTTVMSVGYGNNVGIGTTAPDAKLTVKGVIHAEEVKVDLAVPGPDYVFDEGYPLRSLEDTKTYIDQNKHLPGIPSSDEMQLNGVNLLEMNMKLLEKVEELTLHLIEMKKIIHEQDLKIDSQQRDINQLKTEKK